MSQAHSFSHDDLAELRSLQHKASRPAVVSFLAATIKAHEDTNMAAAAAETAAVKAVPATASSSAGTTATTKAIRAIQTFSYAESSKSVTVYVTIPPSLADAPPEPILDCTTNSFHVDLPEGDRVVHRFKIAVLERAIVPEECSAKVKNGKVIVTLRKANAGDWGSLAKKKKEISPLDKSPNADPSDSIMNLMKQMYDSGDDKMKQMINKTWAESNEKTRSGKPFSTPDFGDMGGFDDL